MAKKDTNTPAANEAGEWDGVFLDSKRNKNKTSWNKIGWSLVLVLFIAMIGYGGILFISVNDLVLAKSDLAAEVALQNRKIIILEKQKLKLAQRNEQLETERTQHQTVTKLIATYISKRNRKIGVNQAYVLAESFVATANEFDIDPFFLTAQANIESFFEMFSKSKKGALGIMQVMPNIWVKAIPFIDSRDDLLNPVVNIRAGGFVLAHYRKKCGNDYERILKCYHGGKRALTRPKQVTIDYVRDVFYRWKTVELH